MRYLVTRPEPDCRQTARLLMAAGHRVDVAPLLTFRPLRPAELDLTAVSALAVTSRRTVDALMSAPKLRSLVGLPVFAVGDATAEACRAAGFEKVFSASGDLLALGEMILGHKADLAGGVVLYPAARDRAGNLEDILRSGGVDCRVSTVYEMAAATTFPADVATALENGAYDGVLVYSRRTADILWSLLKSYGFDHIFSDLMIYSISRRAADPLTGSMPVKVASAPCEPALLELVLANC